MSYYDSNADVFFTDTAHLDMRELYEKFLAKIVAGGSILDAGCGSGRDAHYFGKLGYEVAAFDSSLELVRRANQEFGLNVQHSAFLDFNFNREFDGIWACASLLHLPSAQLPMAFANLEKHLKRDGLLYCSFKYGTFEGKRIGRYYKDFTEETFKEFLQKRANLKLIEEWVSNDQRKDHEFEKWLNCIVVKY